MDENRIVELLTRKIAGEASAEELGELSYLLTKYPDSVYYEALLEQVWDLGNEEIQLIPNGAFNKHKVKFKEELAFKRSKNGIKRPSVYTLAIVCVFIAIGAFIFGQNRQPMNPEKVVVIAGKGVRKEVRLPDGTLVRLNSDSKLTYDRNMQNSDVREIELIGEAYFRVAHDKQRAFIATTNKIAVRVLGTEFNIREYPGENKSETTLLTGSIELTINDRAGQKFVLKPSEKFALMDKETGSSKTENNSVMIIEHISPVKVGDKEYIREISWIENKLVFQNESFEDLLPKLERWYNVKIKLDNPKIRSYRFTGIFIDENLAQALEAMQLIKPFNYKLTANEIKIY